MHFSGYLSVTYKVFIATIEVQIVPLLDIGNESAVEIVTRRASIKYLSLFHLS